MLVMKRSILTFVTLATLIALAVATGYSLHLRTSLRQQASDWAIRNHWAIRECEEDAVLNPTYTTCKLTRDSSDLRYDSKRSTSKTFN